jgi:hypothetical protein
LTGVFASASATPPQGWSTGCLHAIVLWPLGCWPEMHDSFGIIVTVFSLGQQICGKSKIHKRPSIPKYLSHLTFTSTLIIHLIKKIKIIKKLIYI